MPDTTRDWQQWGRFDPFYAVASVPGRDRAGSNPWTEADFYAHGAAQWAEIRPHWGQYAAPLAGTVLEVGCGAGRMSRQLAGSFDAIVAVDVSPDQLELARAAVADVSDAGEFRLATGAALAAGDGEVDGVFSTHVLQHLQPKLVGALLADCGRVLRPGGTTMLHVPIAGTSNASSHLGDMARRWSGLAPVRAAALRVGHRLGRTVPPMRFQLFDPAWVFDRLAAGGLADAELHVFEVGGMRHSFFMARKPAGDGSGAQAADVTAGA
jgi:SAM-dependent methyltransferase